MSGQCPWLSLRCKRAWPCCLLRPPHPSLEARLSQGHRGLHWQCYRQCSVNAKLDSGSISETPATRHISALAWLSLPL